MALILAIEPWFALRAHAMLLDELSRHQSGSAVPPVFNGKIFLTRCKCSPMLKRPVLKLSTFSAYKIRHPSIDGIKVFQ